LVAGTLDNDLLSSLLIEETLHNGPDAREQHRCVHNEGVSHDLRVVVTAYLGGKLDKGINLLRKDLHASTIEVKDVEALLNALASDC